MSAQTPTSHSRSTQRTASPRSTISRNHLSGCEGCILPHFRGINKAGSPLGAGKPLRCWLTSPTGRPRFPTAARPLGGQEGSPGAAPRAPRGHAATPAPQAPCPPGKNEARPTFPSPIFRPKRRQQQRPVPLQSSRWGCQPRRPPLTVRDLGRCCRGKEAGGPAREAGAGRGKRGGRCPAAPQQTRAAASAAARGSGAMHNARPREPRRQGGAGAGRGGEGSDEPAGGSRRESRTSTTPDPYTPHTPLVPRGVYRQPLPSVPAAARRAGPPPSPPPG